MTLQQIKQAAAEIIAFRRTTGRDQKVIVRCKSGMPERGVFINKILPFSLEVTSTSGGVYDIEFSKISEIA